MRTMLLGLAGLMFMAFGAVAQEAAAPVEAAVSAAEEEEAADQGPVVVTVGSYIQNITEINFRTNKATVDFYIWFRWQGDELQPHESFELVNGEVADRNVQEVRKVGDTNYAYARVRAVLSVPWDMDNFSLDRQVIPIMIEDSDADNTEMIYVVDKANVSVRKSIWLPGYKLGDQEGTIVTYTYDTNFGDPNLPPGTETTYSRYVHYVHIYRPDSAYFLKLFATMFLSTLVVAVAFVLGPDNIDGRLGLGVGALFAVVATNYVISAQLPDTDTVTLADKVNFLSMSVIALSLVLAVASWRLHIGGARPSIVAALDKVGLVVLPAVYIAYIAAMALAAGRHDGLAPTF